MVKIRLTRVGRKKLPAYRIVVADSRAARDGRFIEILGWYQPLNKEKSFELNSEKALEWLKQGARPSDTVKSLLRQTGVMKEFHEYKCELAAIRKARRKAAAGESATAEPETATTETDTPVIAETETPVVEEAAESHEELAASNEEAVAAPGETDAPAALEEVPTQSEEEEEQPSAPTP